MRLRIKSESGQAATEYVLLLVVTVGLVLALITQFFKPLQSFIDSYLGDYTACLLQTGELPSFGGESTIAAYEGCETKFAPGTLANGRPPLDSVGSSKSGNGKNGSSSRGSGAVEGAGYAGSSSRGGSNRMFNSSRGTKSGDAGGADASKTTEIAVEGGGGAGSFFNTSSSGTIIIRRNKTVAVSGAQFSAEMKKKIEKKQAGARRVVAADGLSTPPKKIAIKKPERKIDSVVEDEEFTIGNFMRMLFIIGIILAIVVFVGGQVLQMSKNGDN